MGDSNEHPLRAYRKRTETSLDALAGKVGVTRSWLSRIECGAERPSLALIEKLKIETGLSADDFCRPLVGMQT